MTTILAHVPDHELHRLHRMGNEMAAIASTRKDGADWPTSWVLAGRSLADLSAFEMVARLLEAYRGAREAGR